MKVIDVLFFIEHKDREMEGTLAVKKKLESIGISVAIASIEFGMFDAWRRFDPKMICLPYCKSSKSVSYRIFHTKNPHTLFLNLNYEQLLGPKTEIFKRPRDYFAKKELYHFAWGDSFKKYLLFNEVPDEHIYIVGKPEIQFLFEKKQKENNLKHQIAKKAGLSESKKWCFFPFNDGAAFRSDKTVEILAKKAGVSYDLIKSSRDTAFDQIKKLFEFISDISPSVKDEYEFIYRPHPGVPVRRVKDLMEAQGFSSDLIRINRDYTIKEWLCCSDICISNWSTSMVDAVQIGVKSFSFLQQEIPEIVQAEWLSRLPNISNKDDFGKCFVQGDIDYPLKSDAFRDFIDQSGNVIDRWGDAIINILKNYPQSSIRKHPIISAVSGWKNLLRSEARRILQKYFSGLLVRKNILYDYFETI